MTSDTALIHHSAHQHRLRNASLIIAAFALGYAAASIPRNPGVTDQTLQSASPTIHEDWHGNVMRSTPSR